MRTGDTAMFQERGADVPIEWVYPGAEACEWVHDSEHWPAPLVPMELWLHKHWPSGLDRAWAEVGMEPPAVFYRLQYAGPFLYTRETPYGSERMMRAGLRYRDVAREHGGALTFWREYCRPRIEAVCREVAAAGDDAELRHIADLWAYGFHQTFTSLALLFEANMRLTAMLTAAGGDAGALAALEVIQGGANATQAIDDEIWGLADLARRTPAVETALRRDTAPDELAALRREPKAGPFIAAFDALIERHGSRAQGWDLMQRTWRESPASVLALIRARLNIEGPSPEVAAAASAARRHAATQRALSILPPDGHAEFSKTLARLDGYVGIREDRAYCQMVLSGEVRSLLLRIGARLMSSGRTERADDVFFLEPHEIG
ncbi:MAG: hypothetical protein ACREMU_06480, partial [Gemmatimonadaceae bacterium]